MPFRQAVLGVPALGTVTGGVDRSRYVCLDRNESAASIPPAVTRALQEAVAAGVQRYPEDAALLAPLAAYVGAGSECLLPTNGSDTAIDVVLRAFLEPGRRMLVARPEFPAFSHAAALAGAEVVGVPFGPDLRFPYDDFRSAASSISPDLIVLINPNNPTGSPVDAEFVAETVRAHPGIPVVVDEAYYEFTRETCVGLVAECPNLIVLRTFSKAFAMAGLRLGYAVSQAENIAVLRRARQIFDVNALAVAAGVAHLAELDAMCAHVGEVLRVKEGVVAALAARGVTLWQGAGNFVVVRPRRPDAVDSLRGSGVLVRGLSGEPVEGCFRLSIGSEAEMARFLDVAEACGV